MDSLFWKLASREQVLRTPGGTPGWSGVERVPEARECIYFKMPGAAAWPAPVCSCLSWDTAEALVRVTARR